MVLLESCLCHHGDFHNRKGKRAMEIVRFAVVALLRKSKKDCISDINKLKKIKAYENHYIDYRIVGCGV